VSETNPESGEKKSGDIAGEFRELGKNLQSLIRSVWESDERKKFKEELQEGLSELGSMVNETASEIKNSQTGQRLKDDVKDLRQRVRSGEVENKVREEVLSALRTVNSELKKVSSRKPGGDESKKE